MKVRPGSWTWISGIGTDMYLDVVSYSNKDTEDGWATQEIILSAKINPIISYPTDYEFHISLIP